MNSETKKDSHDAAPSQLSIRINGTTSQSRTRHNAKFTTKPANMQAEIGGNAPKNVLLDALKQGEENAICGVKLAEMLGLQSTRELRRIVATARANGIIILGTKKGYFLPSSDPAQALHEIDFFCQRQDCRIRSNRAATASAQKKRQELRQRFSDHRIMQDGDCD